VTPSIDPLSLLRSNNDTAASNRSPGPETTSPEHGPPRLPRPRAQLPLPWRAGLGQYAGFRHAGIIGALIDTACGFAAATVVGRVLAAHYSVNCLRPAVGEAFIARARVVKPGKSQVFTACELYARKEGQEILVATGETLLTVIADGKTG